MSLVQLTKHLAAHLEQIAKDLIKAEKGNRAAAQRVRTGTIKLEKIAKQYRKESVKTSKGKKRPAAKKAKKAPARKKAATKKKAPARKKAAAKRKAPARKKAAAKRKAPARKKTSARRTPSRKKARRR
mgnify:CR=1 FL=1